MAQRSTVRLENLTHRRDKHPTPLASLPCCSTGVKRSEHLFDSLLTETTLDHVVLDRRGVILRPSLLRDLQQPPQPSGGSGPRLTGCARKPRPYLGSVTAGETPPPFGRWWMVTNGLLAAAFLVLLAWNLVGGGPWWRSLFYLSMAGFAVERGWRLGQPRTRIDAAGLHTRGDWRTRHIPGDQVVGEPTYDVYQEGLTVLVDDETRHVLWDTKWEHQDQVADLIERATAH